MLVVVLFLMSGSVQANNTLPEAVIGVSPARDWFYNLEDVFFDSGDSSDPNGYISYTKWYINGVLHTSGSYWRNMSECFALYGSPSNGCYELGVGETTVEIELRVQDNSGNWDIETKIITIREYKGRKYFIKDHLGSVRTTVTREDGKVLGYDDYYPFGLTMPGRSSNTTNSNDNYKFTGHERDEEASLTLDYMMARNYDPMIGRFLQVDPLAAKYPGWSPYNYTLNNPIRYWDPDGRTPIQRDENGKVVYVSDGTQGNFTHPSGSKATLEVGYIFADNGTPIQVFKNTGGGDEGWDANCHGTTFADGEFWLNNNQVPALIAGDGYEEISSVSDLQEGDALLYLGGTGEAEHSVTVAATDGTVLGLKVVGLGGLETSTHVDNATEAWPTAASAAAFRKTTPDIVATEQDIEKLREKVYPKDN